MREIRIDEQELNASFDRLLDKMYLQYHYFPTNIPHYNLPPGVEAEISHLTALTEQMTGRAKDQAKVKIREFCNGLPVDGGPVGMRRKR